MNQQTADLILISKLQFSLASTNVTNKFSSELILVSQTCFLHVQLLEEYRQNISETVQLLNMADLYIMPVANPDGYIYTHEEVGSFKPLTARYQLYRQSRCHILSNICCNKRLPRYCVIHILYY